MPPSPALRCSPGREPRGANHKRGRSLESGLLFREKDDLALFNEMQTRERDNFLLQSTDDIEDTFSTKLRHFSANKLGISIPARGESSDLLNADEEKNDYDWLLTPPDTPLFPSLDDEPQPVNAAPRGRPRSQPISISRSSTMEKSFRSSRGSASPNRLSPSPRSGSGTFQSRGRPSSATHSSPPPGLRHATPSRRPSTPPSKPSTPAPRSSTPTPRRVSTGSSGNMASPVTRGPSPIKTNRGNSASPKVRAWQANIPGFSSDAPPNLRTSLADRPASYVRGSSPASRNGRDSTSKFNRQSMSPTASRSISSSHSHDRDRFSSHSKGSVASSGDDDVDSLQSIHVGSLDRATSRRVGALSNNQALPFSKKSTRIVSSISTPKKSLDFVLRQTDNRKIPQNMFRPLLSSVPSTTFYGGKASSAYRSLISRNSSVTTSSNTSSDQGVGAALDTEGSDPNQDDAASECGKVAYPDVHEEVFAFDKMDVVNEGIGHEVPVVSLHIQNADFDKGPAVDYVNVDSGNSSHHGIAMGINLTSAAFHAKADYSEVDILENMEICLKCGSTYIAVDEPEGGIELCPECWRKDKILSAIIPETATVVPVKSPLMSTNISAEEKPSDEMEPQIIIPEFEHIAYVGEPNVSQGEENVEQGQTPLSEQQHNYSREYAKSLMEEAEHRDVNEQERCQPTVGYRITDNEIGGRQLHHYNEYPNLKVDFSEGTGISILLKKSSSNKGPVFQGRTFTAATIPYDDLSLARDSVSSMRSSIGHGSFSASSSIDFSLARQTESRVQRQLSSRKSDLENYRYDINTKPQSNGSSLSGSSNPAHLGSDLASSTFIEENSEVSAGNVKDAKVETPTAYEEQALVLEYMQAGATGTSFTGTTVVENDNFECDDGSRALDAPNFEMSSHVVSVQLEDNINYEDCVSCGNGQNFTENASTMDMEASNRTPDSSFGEELALLNGSIDEVDVAQVPSQSTLVTMSDGKAEQCCQSTPGSQIDEVSLIWKSTKGELQESYVTASSEGDLIAAVSEPNTSDYAHGILEESTVMVDGQGGSKSRSLTLEEATDTILFCSSIVQDLAYQAATMAMEKESSIPLEGSWPTVTILGKSNSERKVPRGRTAGKRTSKAQKARQRQVETDAKPASNKTENDENVDDSLTRYVGIPNKVDSMKPPKLESKCNCTIM
ncbi:hypothetical protein F2P56_029845 [Juglans regia]|uniref:Uncharacterized protein LOC109019517 n=2 Tax=Juglans regia TaxID=51240 RepID=A0A2I4HMH0_JUGRE|nr:uncharacterized protein LOC109019517 [Juglans regia]XP_018857359.2 uncharacterized protein LOC109019517 [Juglans regia]KAF5449395.1 hypothetical protein F2P56_029845 [Juglans regia]